MDMVNHIRNLLAYDDWANHEVLTALQALKTPPARSLKFVAHILSAERLWLERLEQRNQTLPIWPDFDLQGCEQQMIDLKELWRNYLDNKTERDLSETINYKNTKGETFDSRRRDVLLHVIMHSTYHRGQIAADMRAAGFTPPYTDFIHAVRMGLLE